MIVSTPVEKHKVRDQTILVKREDLSCLLPGPPFSKVRGLFSHLKKLKDRGVRTIGYTETSISMAGWGVAWASKELGLETVIFDPQYVQTPGVLAYHRQQWKKFGAKIEPIKAGMARVNYNISKKILKEKYGDNAVLLPLGLPLEESIEETAKEFERVQEHFSTLVVNVGSGTICAGLIKGMKEGIIYGIMGRKGDKRRKEFSILRKSGKLIGGLLGDSIEFHLIDLGYEYTDTEYYECPFPCNPYYDRKAWKWLVDNIDILKRPVLFWNIGA